MFSPGGKPVPMKVYGAVPPVGDTVALYTTPTVPTGSVVGMASGWTIVIVTLAVAVRCVGLVESVAVMTAVLVTADGPGVPVIWPAVEILKPAGNPVAVKVYGAVPPLATTFVGVYGVPTIPTGGVRGVMLSGVTTFTVVVPDTNPEADPVIVVVPTPTGVSATWTLVWFTGMVAVAGTVAMLLLPQAD